jgi:hypothetical protein
LKDLHWIENESRFHVFIESKNKLPIERKAALDFKKLKTHLHLINSVYHQQSEQKGVETKIWAIINLVSGTGLPLVVCGIQQAEGGGGGCEILEER